jgi:hypothetical protein
MVFSGMLRRVALVRTDVSEEPGASFIRVTTYFQSISRVLARHNIKSVDLRHMKLSSLLCPVKDHLGLRTPGIYRILCECGRVYIRQTGRSVDIRIKEQQRHIRLDHPVKSAVAEHSIDQGHCIQFHNASENQIYEPHCQGGH